MGDGKGTILLAESAGNSTPGRGDLLLEKFARHRIVQFRGTLLPSVTRKFTRGGALVIAWFPLSTTAYGAGPCFRRLS